MKKTLLLASVFAVGAALATDFGSANALGVLQVSGSSKPKKVLLSVPFAGYGKDADGKDAKIKVSELVETSTLPEYTELRVACEGGYYTWQLEKIDDQKAWKPMNDAVVSIDANGEQEQNKVTTPPADEVMIGRGNSFWLELPSDPTGITYTLIGQQDLSGSTGVALTGGKWNLVGNPNVANYNVSAKILLKAKGDCISVQNGTTGFVKTYWFDGGKWWCGLSSVDNFEINPGDGCWVLVASDTTLKF